MPSSAGSTEIILGIGGSATNDAGAGLAQALGVRFLNFGGAPIRDLIAGGDLDDVQAVDMSVVNPGLAKIHISVACDVTNPLCGEKGASRVYGPQKGATPEMVERLDKNLAHFAHIIKRSIGADVIDRPGAGAGGGIGAGLMAFTNATLKRGVELVVAATRLEEIMRGADLAVTGEGRVDFQTAFGKTPSGVAAAARKHGVPVVAIGGGLSDDAGGVFAARHRRPRIGDAQCHAARRGDQKVPAIPAGCRRARRASDHHRSAHVEVPGPERPSNFDALPPFLSMGHAACGHAK